MSKGLEELKRLAYENACCRCQYYIDKKCTNEGECVWKTIEKELKEHEQYKAIEEELGIDQRGIRKMKAILMSIRPEWVAKILNGKKTIEIRKGTKLHKAIQGLIKEQGVAPMLIYCTKGKPYIYDSEKYYFAFLTTERRFIKSNHLHMNNKEVYQYLNGKVIARFNATSEIISFYQHKTFFNDGYEKEPTVVWKDYHTPSFACGLLEEPSCLTFEQMHNYLKGEQGTAAHITKDTLTIFIKPMELKEFRRHCDKHFSWRTIRCLDCKAYTPDPDIEDYCNKNKLALTKAPQSWCYVEI